MQPPSSLGFNAGFICVCWPVDMDLCHRVYISVGRDLRTHLLQTVLFVAVLSNGTQFVICMARSYTEEG